MQGGVRVKHEAENLGQGFRRFPVIIPVAEYNAMLALLREAASRDEDALDALRRKFDERMASLKAPGAGEKLNSMFDKPLALGGRVIAGESF